MRWQISRRQISFICLRPMRTMKRLSFSRLKFKSAWYRNCQNALPKSMAERSIRTLTTCSRCRWTGKKLGLDQRLINPMLPDDPGSKVNACVGNVMRIYREGSEQKLTQLIFSDMSTPKNGQEKGIQRL